MKTSLYILAGVLALAGCKNDKSVPESEQEELADNGPVTVETTVGPLELPAPFASESVTKESKIVAWPSGTTPTAAEGFKVERFADSLKHPRWTYVAPNNDIFVAESNTLKTAPTALLYCVIPTAMVK